MKFAEKMNFIKAATNSLLRGLQICFILVAVGALVMFLWPKWNYFQSQKTFSRMEQEYVQPIPAVSQEQGSDSYPQLIEVDFTSLQREYPHIVAWIQWPLLDISLPVVHGETNDQYLRRLPDGSWNEGGSIFLEAANKGMEDLHTILYGHNMNDGSMFGNLVSFLDEEFYLHHENDAVFYIYTPQGVWEYQLFSVEKVISTDPHVYMVGYTRGEEFREFVETMKQRSLYKMTANIDGSQPVITLSTCDEANPYTANRVVLHGVRNEKIR